MEFEDDEILQGFIEESLEHLADIENDLLTIEEGGANIDEELVNKVFRAAHSIKGGAGFMGLTSIQELSHASENVLGLIRSKKLIPNPEIINVLLLASDQLRQMIEDVQNSNEVDISAHLDPLNSIFDGTFAQAAAAEPKKKATAPKKKAAEPVVEIEPEPEPTVAEPEPEPELAEEEDVLDQEDEEIEEEEDIPATVVSNPQRIQDTDQAKKSTPATKVETSIRVNVSLLDSLMTLAGELVLSRNQLLQTIGTDDFRNAETVGQRIDLITSELQEAIMLTRMQPIGNVFNKFPRVVRDLSKKLAKKIDLTIVGKDVELDKTIIEAINDPLTHLIRNSVDHGIEMPAERKKKGKPETGLVILKAYHEAGQVVIEIRDDGKGIDGDALAASAVAKGLLTADQIKVMSEKEKVNLIFLPGFSTAAKVTDVSGRGVGMDVVKTNLDQLGGHVDILSEVGLGTTISIKLPLTLAIIPCQIIMTGDERYAIPQVNLEELLRIPANQVKERVERVGDAEVVRLRGNLLPLIRLSDVIGLDRTFWDDKDQTFKEDRREMISDRRSKASPLFGTSDKSQSEQQQRPNRSVIDRRYAASSALNIVVVSTGAMKYGLVVDRLLDSEEIVIKPLGRHLQQCKGYAGATIMGDGRIALILDVANLARMSNLTSLDGSDRATEIAHSMEEAIKAKKDKQALLIFRSSETEQFAVPLNQVERIEKIKASDIEMLGGKRVMKYRGGSLSLIRVDDLAMVQPLADYDNLLVIVFNVAKHNVGLLAIGPIDALEITADIDDITLKQPGIMGSLIIDTHTTMLVNIFELVQNLFPDWFDSIEVFDAVETTDGSAPTILLAEDSNFFRNQVKGYMTEAGYEVIEAEDGQIAWDLLQQNREVISMVITDIEMPNMDGFQFTKTIRSDPRFTGLPVIALTTLAAEEDVAKGIAVGVNEYHLKLDKEKLMTSVHHFMKQRY
ncbi:hybrid sensor histidine kinase/response regulator [Desulfopila aestuarii]|uniref:histidine kinase n=1 Tax=Desulfopila aestuarii DSM 18488 TaxID=1121416 RepID=A0A1M7YDK0_9BACT|nr:hybrid sensor histidine kinase/response regulator [Desulfopila aestuarii]SHO50683.1 two-component system, chemotaxis family, sensor kinase CheA [Desulfopila aestuarii DSM 18488]